MKSIIHDVSILSKVFETYSEVQLKKWGFSSSDWETISVKASFLKRIFIMKKEYTHAEQQPILYFTDPENYTASILFSNADILPDDTFTVTYTIYATPGSGPNSVTINNGRGKALRVILYATVS